MMHAPTHRPIRKIVLITQFESYFVERDVLLALRERGVEIMAVFDPRRLPPIATWDALAREGCDTILHMHEVGSHSDSQRISTLVAVAMLPPACPVAGEHPSGSAAPQATFGGNPRRERRHHHGSEEESSGGSREEVGGEEVRQEVGEEVRREVEPGHEGATIPGRGPWRACPHRATTTALLRGNGPQRDKRRVTHGPKP